MNQQEADLYYQQGQQFYNAQRGERSNNLLQAIEQYEKSLQYYTFEAFPEKWEEIQREMTVAYDDLVQLRRTQPLSQPGPLAVRSPRRLRFTRIQRLVFVFVIVFLLIIPTTAAIARTYFGRGGPACVDGELIIDGSTALQPLVEAAAEEYMQHCSNTHITVGGGASKTGLADVEQGHNVVDGVYAGKDYAHIGRRDVSIQIGDSDIFALPTQHNLMDHQVGINVFAIILNKDVTGVHNLTTAQIQKIYTGVYQNWKAVCDQKSGLCGPDLSIVPISRTLNSGTRFTFERYVLNGVATVPGIGLERTLSSGDAVQEVKDNAGGIGYAPLYLANQAHDITAVSIDGLDPHDSSLVRNNQYKFWNIEHMYTREAGNQLAQAFINYMYSDEVQHLLPQYNLIRLTDIPQNIRQEHALEAQ